MDAHGEEAFRFLNASFVGQQTGAEASHFADAISATSAGISAEMPYETQFIEIKGSQMAYID